MQCFQMFSNVLSGKESASGLENGSVLDTAEEGKREWYQYTLAQLRAFARKYHAPAASFIDGLEIEVFAESKVSPGLREALLLSLHP